MIATMPSVAGQDPVPTTEPDATDTTGEGQSCLACDMPIEGPIQTVQHKGRRVHLHAGDCVDHWLDHTDAVFAKVQARGALYDEQAVSVDGLGPGWLIFGIYVLGGLIFGAACAYVALARGMNALTWFILGFLLNIGALIGLLVMGRGDISIYPAGVPRGLRKIPITRLPQSCDCGAANHPSASRCSACGATLTASIESEVARA